VVAKFPLAVVISGKDVSLESTLGRADMRLRATAQVAGQLGKALTLGVSLPLAAMGTIAVRTGTQVETNLLQIRAAANLTTAQTEDLHKFARGFNEMGVGVRETTEGMVAFAKAGLDVGAIKNVMLPTITLAKNETMEFDRVSEGLVGVITGYRKPFSDAAIVADQLTVAAQATTNSLNDLFEAFTQGAPAGAGFKQPFEDTLAMIALMGQANFKATLGGTAYRNAFSRLANQSTETQERLQKLLGPDFQKKITDGNGNLIRMVDILHQLEKAGADTKDMFAIFGERGGPGLATLIGQGNAAIEDLISKLRPLNASGESLRKYQVTMSGAKGAQDRLMASLQNLADSVAQSGLLDAFTSVVKRLDDWTKALDSLSPGAKRFSLWVGGFAILAGPLISFISKSVYMWQTAKALRSIAVATEAIAAAETAAGTAAAIAAPKVALLNTELKGLAAFARILGLPILFALIAGGDNETERRSQQAEGLTHARLKAISEEAGASPYSGSSPMNVAEMQARISYLQSLGYGHGKEFQRLEVIFKNAPAGTTVNASKADSVDVDVGYSMATP